WSGRGVGVRANGRNERGAQVCAARRANPGRGGAGIRGALWYSESECGGCAAAVSCERIAGAGAVCGVGRDARGVGGEAAGARGASGGERGRAVGVVAGADAIAAVAGGEGRGGVVAAVSGGADWRGVSVEAIVGGGGGGTGAGGVE